MAVKHREAYNQLVESTKNSLKKYETYLDCSEDLVNYLLQMVRRETEISKAILENAFVG